MQFKSAVISLFLTATSVQGLPGSLAERQEIGVTYEILASCPDGRVLDSGSWVDSDPNTPGESPCVDIATPQEFFGDQIGVNIVTANSPKNLTVWNVDGCTAWNNSGSFVQFDAHETGCKILPARRGTIGPIAQSVQFGTIDPAAEP